MYSESGATGSTEKHSTAQRNAIGQGNKRNILRSATLGVIFARGKPSYVFFGGGELCGQHRFGRGRRGHADEGETPSRTAFRVAPYPVCRSSVYRGFRLAGIGWNPIACGNARHGRSVHAVCAGTSPFFDAAKRAAV